MDYVINFIKKKKPKNVNEKKEEELTLDDRLQLIEEHKVSCNEIFGALLDIKFNEKKTVKINERVFNDLEFFVDNDNKLDNTIYGKINKTKTELGNNYLKYTLQKPLYDINLLKGRQSVQQKYMGLGHAKIREIEKSLDKIR